MWISEAEYVIEILFSGHGFLLNILNLCKWGGGEGAGCFRKTKLPVWPASATSTKQAKTGAETRTFRAFGLFFFSIQILKKTLNHDRRKHAAVNRFF